MSLLEKPTAVHVVHDSSGSGRFPPSGAEEPPRRRLRHVLPWLGIAVALLGLAVLVDQLVESGAAPDRVDQQVITDPKDRPGYRSPTIDRPLTTGDPKDWPGYRPVAGDPPAGDPKDRPGYRSPTIDRPLTTGDAKDWPGFGSATGRVTPPATATG